MQRDDLVAVPEAARRLGLSAPRVWRLVAAELLPAVEVGGRQLIPVVEVERLARQRRPRGRPLGPAHAWALLALIGGDAQLVEAMMAGADRRWRFRLAALVRDADDPADLSALTRYRSASPRRYSVPGPVLDRVRERIANAGVVTGAASLSARAAGLGEFEPHLDAYAAADGIAEIAAHYRLARCFGGENLILRPLPGEVARRLLATRSDDGRPREAPPPAVALDLHDDLDERRRAVGADVLRQILRDRLSR